MSAEDFADADAVFEDGVLLSTRFGDVYASRAGALAQARNVFLNGCGLPDAWAGRRHFTVAELGFGTGLNILALLDLWQRHRPADARLQILSVEAWPLRREQAAQALAAHGELRCLADRLLAAWPEQKSGRLRIDFADIGATLDLVLADAHVALAEWTGRADAWFLDGFAPARNPQMWTADLLRLVAAHTAPGGRIATWSVAGHVRRALADAGLQVERRPGFGGKRARLEAVQPGVPAADPPLPRVAILGAGIAGAALARAFRAAGVSARVFADSASGGPMASGNPAALLAPRLVSGSAAASGLHAQAFGRAVTLIRREAADAIIAEGADWWLKRDEPARAAATLASGLYPDGSLRMEGGRLHLRDALVVAPERLRRCWLPGEVVPLRLDRPRRAGDGWWLADFGPFDTVVLAAGIGTAALADLPLRPVRGQVTTARLPLRPRPESWGGYLIPTDDGLLFGATHGRGDADWSVRADDEQVNLAALARMKPELAAMLSQQPLQSFAGVRAATGYNQPIARRVDSGLFALTALAGRGFTLAPLLAEHVAALVLGRASPLARPAIRLVDCMRADSVTPAGGAASAICAARTDTGLEIPVASA